MLKAGVSHLVTIKRADVFLLDLSPASVVTLYLYPWLNVALKPMRRVIYQWLVPWQEES